MDLDRFVTAQDSGGTYAGRSPSCGPDARPATGCGSCSPRSPASVTAPWPRRTPSADLAEARAYLAHPVLGPRLRECVEAVGAHAGRSAEQIMGGIDAMKLRSSLTLFARADPDEPLFTRVLEQYFAGPDPQTEQRL